MVSSFWDTLELHVKRVVKVIDYIESKHENSNDENQTSLKVFLFLFKSLHVRFSVVIEQKYARLRHQRSEETYGIDERWCELCVVLNLQIFGRAVYASDFHALLNAI